MDMFVHSMGCGLNLLEQTYLNLVDSRLNFAVFQQTFHLLQVEVGDPDALRQPFGQHGLEPAPRVYVVDLLVHAFLLE